jgi:hypothetical protein
MSDEFLCDHGLPWKVIEFVAKTGRMAGRKGKMRVCAADDRDCQPPQGFKFLRDNGSNPAPHKPTSSRSGPPGVAAVPDPYKNRRAALIAASNGFRDIKGVQDAAAEYEKWLDRPFPAKPVPEVVPLPQEDIEFDPGNL